MAHVRVFIKVQGQRCRLCQADRSLFVRQYPLLQCVANGLVAIKCEEAGFILSVDIGVLTRWIDKKLRDFEAGSENGVSINLRTVALSEPRFAEVGSSLR